MKRIKEWFREGMNAAGQRGVEVKAAVLGEANTAFDLNTNLFTTIKTSTELDDDSKEIPVIIEQTPPHDKTYPISQVMAVIAAVCLAHFIIVTGGLTGDKGYQKLRTLEYWLTTYWQSSE